MFISVVALLHDFKIALNSGLVIINPWMYNKLVTCSETLSTPVNEQQSKYKINLYITGEKTVTPARISSNHLPTTLLYKIITPNTRFVAHSSGVNTFLSTPHITVFSLRLLV